MSVRAPRGQAVARLSVALLGRTRVSVDGRPVELTARKPRSILAMLALEAGRPLSTDALIDGLWGDEPPDSASNAVQVYIAGLRRALGPGAWRLRTEASGYALEVDDVDVDVLAFERAVASARADGSGSQVWSEVLAAWAGPPFADLGDPPFAGPRATRLHELHSAATEEWMDAELALGRHRDVVPELEAIVAREPYRERSWRQLIVALYRSDRQADALAAYRQARDVLAADLGIDPGPALQAVEHAVLVQDPSLALAPRAELGVHLPTFLSTTVDRVGDRAAVAALLEHSRLVTIVGPGGMGKTRLAVEVARAQAARFAGGVRFIDLAAVRDRSLVLGEIARALDITSGDDPIASMQALIGEDRALLVLDNLEQVVDAAPDILALLEALPGASVLATSRHHLRLAAENVHVLEPLDDVDATELFAVRGRAIRPDLVIDGQIDALMRRLEGLPLAIELAAAGCRVLDLAEVASRVISRAPLPPGPRELPDRQRSIEANLAWSAELLDPGTRMLLIELAAFEAPFDLAMAQVLSGSPDDVTALLGELVESSLLVPEGGRYRMLASVREFARGGAGSVGEVVADRHAAWVQSAVAGCLDRIRADEDAAALSELGGLLPDLRASLDHLAARGRHEEAARLLLAPMIAWYHFGLLDEASRRFQVAAAQDGLEPRTRAEALMMTTLFAKLMGTDPDVRTTLEARVDAVRPLTDDSTNLANALCHLAAMEAEAGLAEQAFAHAGEALAVARRGPDPGLVAMALDLSGYVARVVGDHGRSVAAQEAAVALARQIGSSQILNALAGLAAALGEAGRQQEALDAAWEAIALAERDWTPTQQAEVATTVGSVLARADPGEAATRLAAAVATWIAHGKHSTALDAGILLAELADDADAPAATRLVAGLSAAAPGRAPQARGMQDAQRARLGDGAFARERAAGMVLDGDALGRLAADLAGIVRGRTVA